jgi:hypothetical protein
MKIKNKSRSNEFSGSRWLLLIHHVPPKPAYFRVKIWRRLQKIGAVPIKNSVYVLPKSDQANESFEWIVREIAGAGGDSMICEARLIDGLTDREVENIFKADRNNYYGALIDEAENLKKKFSKKNGSTESERARLKGAATRLKVQFDGIVALDFFGANRKVAARALINGLEKLTEKPDVRRIADMPIPKDLKGRTWVTRRGMHIDRMASAWLIKRFIDKNAKFKFVEHKGYKPLAGELRFDMFEAEFTHEGDMCTFEVLLKRMNIAQSPLQTIAEIIHDLDLKDAKYNRPETAGVEAVIDGIATANDEDETRLARSIAVFDDIKFFFDKKP